jgi:glycosyltransferase involved in cell wall biosynthesis
MEEYAFRLCHELSKIGVCIVVICEIKITNPSEKMKVIELGRGSTRPRWLSHLIFSTRVYNWLKQNKKHQGIVHSHERISCHNITTIHSTLFNFPSTGFPSIRKTINEFLEKREVSASKLSRIVPVSQVVANQIKSKFPQASDLLNEPIPPGVVNFSISKKAFDSKCPVIGFMGTEWKRKGLPKVIAIWRELLQKNPDTDLCLAGFPVHEKIGLTKVELERVNILGYVSKDTFYSKIDILLHPAQKEAFGMVIAEALSMDIPVVCSEESGASIFNPCKSNILRYSESIRSWVSVVNRCLATIPESSNKNPQVFSWTESARKYLTIYQEINYTL